MMIAFDKKGRQIYPPKPVTNSCEGCKHLDFYNDGSAFCAKGIDHACILSGFSMKVEGERTT